MKPEQRKDYEIILRSFANGVLSKEAKKIINDNKWMLHERVPYNYCMHHDRYERDCNCRESNWYIKNEKSLGFVALYGKLKDKFINWQAWVKMIEFICVTTQRVFFHCYDDPMRSNDVADTPFKMLFHTLHSTGSPSYFKRHPPKVQNAIDTVLTLTNANQDTYKQCEVVQSTDKPCTDQNSPNVSSTTNEADKCGFETANASTIDLTRDPRLPNPTTLFDKQNEPQPVPPPIQKTEKPKPKTTIDRAVQTDPYVPEKHGTLTDIMPFLEPDPAYPNGIFADELFRMVKKRRFFIEYKHTKLNKQDILNEWDNVRKNLVYREMYFKATEIYNANVNNLKRKLPAEAPRESG